MAKDSTELLNDDDLTDEEVEDLDESKVDEKALITKERQLLEAKITAEFDESFVRVLRRVAYYLSSVGLTLREACQLVQMPMDEMEAKMRNYPMIAELIAFKELEYKADLLATISLKARSGNDKLATWLLESRYPEEFNKRKGAGDGGGDGGDDLIAMGVEYVQRHGDSAPLVSQTAGRAFVIQKGSDNTKAIKRLQEFLK